MPKAEHRSALPLSSAPAGVRAASFAAPPEDAASPLTDVMVRYRHMLRRLHVAMSARCIALVLSDEAAARTRLLGSFVESLAVAEYRVVRVSVPPSATRLTLTRLVARSATLLNEESSFDRGSPLPAYDLLRRFEADVVRSYVVGRRTLLIIDDAQVLTADGLHFVHTLRACLQTKFCKPPKQKLTTARPCDS